MKSDPFVFKTALTECSPGNLTATEYGYIIQAGIGRITKRPNENGA